MNNDPLTRPKLVQSGPDAVRMLLDRLRQHRLTRNWSQAEIARRAHLSRAAYQNFETGRGNITLRNLMKVLWVLGLTHHLAQMVPAIPAEPTLVSPTGPADSTVSRRARRRSYTRRI